MVKDVLTFSKQRVELQIRAVMCAFRLTKKLFAKHDQIWKYYNNAHAYIFALYFAFYLKLNSLNLRRC